jgi:hypothetical protein
MKRANHCINVPPFVSCAHNICETKKSQELKIQILRTIVQVQKTINIHVKAVGVRLLKTTQTKL